MVRKAGTAIDLVVKAAGNGINVPRGTGVGELGARTQELGERAVRTIADRPGGPQARVPARPVRAMLRIGLIGPIGLMRLSDVAHRRAGSQRMAPPTNAFASHGDTARPVVIADAVIEHPLPWSSSLRDGHPASEYDGKGDWRRSQAEAGSRVQIGERSEEAPRGRRLKKSTGRRVRIARLLWTDDQMLSFLPMGVQICLDD
jgi:hypothetical protein